MSREDFIEASEIDSSGKARDLDRDEFGWLRMSSRAGCDPVRAISRADVTRIVGAGR
ncbi:hypothetical protein [Nocardia concava]|uniref:hypothetical protein n=1 Tax=Nocardia concava TaxID=257281 RepID=UPI0002E95226|nr:hypothetical protein [Nocardia concava]